MIFAAGTGHRRGLWLSLFQYVGLVGGVVLGAAIAPAVADLLGVQGTTSRPLIGVVLLIALGSIGSSLGYWLGEPIRLRLRQGRQSGQVDRILGALFSIVAVLGVCWFLGLSFSRGPSPALARLIQYSSTLRYLDRVAPRPPAFLAGVEQVLAGVSFPSTFSGLEPIMGSAPPLPDQVDTPGVQRASHETVEVRSTGVGCNGIITGSGFSVRLNQVLTNAHVVAGTRNNTVLTPDGRQRPATVILFDPERDVAILSVPGLGLAPLNPGTATRGTQGAAIGYPGGQTLTVAAAVVDEVVNAEGRDIFNQGLVTRQILIIESSTATGGPGVRPGNSGGPLVDLNGNLLGVVFAASTSDQTRAYALTNREVSADIQAAAGRTSAVDLGNRCAV
ncbi:MAG: MarP family serine protease [Candidatus Dormibacteraeota bacterium]|nr:MarP family serine protease [Candidatus Dormibacteraeota bacterium]